VLCRVGVSGADVAGLERFELLGCAEFVGLEGRGGLVKKGGRGGGGEGEVPFLGGWVVCLMGEGMVRNGF